MYYTLKVIVFTWSNQYERGLSENDGGGGGIDVQMRQLSTTGHDYALITVESSRQSLEDEESGQEAEMEPTMENSQTPLIPTETSKPSRKESLSLEDLQSGVLPDVCKNLTIRMRQ